MGLIINNDAYMTNKDDCMVNKDAYMGSTIYLGGCNFLPHCSLSTSHAI
jgi:hypothetical protein